MPLSVQVALAPPYAQMVEWQTPRSEGPAPIRACEFESRSAHQYARLVELVDTPVLGTGVRKGMRVRVPRRVPYAQMPEQVYESVSKTDAERCAGSIPALRTICRCGAIGRRIRLKSGKIVGSNPSICTKKAPTTLFKGCRCCLCI